MSTRSPPSMGSTACGSGHFDLSQSLGIPGPVRASGFSRGSRQCRRGRQATQQGARAAGVEGRGRYPAVCTGLRFLLLLRRCSGPCAMRWAAALCRPAPGVQNMSLCSALHRRAIFAKATAARPIRIFDLAPLIFGAGVLEVAYLDAKNPPQAEQLEDFDALILLAHRFDAGSVPKGGRLRRSSRGSASATTRSMSAACTEHGDHRAGDYSRTACGGRSPYRSLTLDAGVDRQTA